MSDKTLKYIIAAIIAMMLIFQVGTLVSAVLGVAWGAVSSIAIAAVLFFSARLAKAGGIKSLWIFLPVVLFTVLPIGLTLWKVLSEEVSWLDRILKLAPFFIGFGIPIVLLLLVYYELRQRTAQSTSAQPPN
ncbi:MAG: hypothetical protein ACOY3V_03915 [Pseudomonadota bacterium]